MVSSIPPLPCHDSAYFAHDVGTFLNLMAASFGDVIVMFLPELLDISASLSALISWSARLGLTLLMQEVIH